MFFKTEVAIESSEMANKLNPKSAETFIENDEREAAVGLGIKLAEVFKFTPVNNNPYHKKLEIVVFSSEQWKDIFNYLSVALEPHQKAIFSSLLPKDEPSIEEKVGPIAVKPWYLVVEDRCRDLKRVLDLWLKAPFVLQNTLFEKRAEWEQEYITHQKWLDENHPAGAFRHTKPKDNIDWNKVK